ncbi:MAG: response regulator transcription factor [Verrucomicrobiales bacterium]|nr:response regulator transcription factor [Verrucomicrobiales bacterium]
MSSNKVQIVIVDDHPVMRMGLIQLLTSTGEFEVCGEAGSAREGSELLENLEHVDLVIVDMALPDKNGIEFIKDLKAMDETIKCLVVSSHDENVYAERVLRAGARGYVMKNQAPKLLVDAVRQVVNGGVFVCEDMMAKMMASIAGLGSRSSVSALTDRELEIFRMIGEGKTTREIAGILNINIRTVDTHRTHIKDKMGLRDAAEVTYRAIQWAESQS